MTKSRALSLIILGSAALLATAACNREKAAEPSSEVSVADGPLSYETSTPYAKVSLTLPEAIKGYPEFYRALYEDEVGALKDYAENAQSDRSEAGGSDLPPYEKTISLSTPVETARLVSMIRSDFDYSGGAHPNSFYTGVLWDKTLNKRVTPEDLLARDDDRQALRRTLCAAINEAKKSRAGSEPISDTSGTWTCPDLKEMQLALSGSDTPQKASGLIFLINHYEVGPYVEGAYFISLPVSALGRALNPAYADDFGGTGKIGDVTNDLIS